MSTYSIVIGDRPFRLSGAALASDAPNLFTRVFSRPREASTRTLALPDKNPEIFELIFRHLQGYCMLPKDEVQYANLLTDAYYFELKKLQSILLEYFFINVGGKVFRISKNIVKNDGPNYFGMLIARNEEKDIPEVIHRIRQPHYIDRDPALFEDVVLHLRGYDVPIRDESHRLNLLKDARYYALRGLREKLMSNQLASTLSIPHAGLLMKLEDIRIVSIVKDSAPSKTGETAEDTNPPNLSFPGIAPLDSFSRPREPILYKLFENKSPLLVQITDARLELRYTHYEISQLWAFEWRVAESTCRNPKCAVYPSNGGSEHVQLDLQLRASESAKLRDLAQKVGVDPRFQTRLDDGCAIAVDGCELLPAELYSLPMLLFVSKRHQMGETRIHDFGKEVNGQAGDLLTPSLLDPDSWRRPSSLWKVLEIARWVKPNLVTASDISDAHGAEGSPEFRVLDVWIRRCIAGVYLTQGSTQLQLDILRLDGWVSPHKINGQVMKFLG
ncbi:uncharacterized protein VTP21DRAFT_3412 [Calcarisporiella thermophila]|uniref:uncharacterized protein n=1 Tax=Calcarisporiella thermophila TaxID=911321 RepID=UPI00374206A6